MRDDFSTAMKKRLKLANDYASSSGVDKSGVDGT
jgi:hypothetical protein